MKKTRGLARCRCTTYIRQPGSWRDASSSFPKMFATSASFPGLATQVTASTTMITPRLRAAYTVERVAERVDENRLLAVRTSGDNADFRGGLFLHKLEIALGPWRQLIVPVDTEGLRLPARKLGVDWLDFFESRGLCWNFLGLLAVDLVANTDWNLGKFI